MIHRVLSYLNHLPKTFHLHGIHSPFVFKLQHECLYDKTVYPDYKHLKKYRDALHSSVETVTVEDYGAGSTVFRSKQRPVSKLARIAGARPKRAQVLYRLVKRFQPKHSLELGTSLGLGTQAMSLGHPEGYVTSVEGAREVATLSRKRLQKHPNVSIINTTFEDYLANIPTDTVFDFVYLDGNHTEVATIRYVETLLPHLREHSVLLLDDIYWSKGMTKAWKAIQKHPSITVTVDTYWFGLAFLRKEQAPEHFSILMV